jgi:hypothetical protein
MNLVIAIIFLAFAGLGLLAFMYFRQEEKNDIAKDIIKEHRKEIEDLKRKYRYE